MTLSLAVHFITVIHMADDRQRLYRVSGDLNSRREEVDRAFAFMRDTTLLTEQPERFSYDVVRIAVHDAARWDEVEQVVFAELATGLGWGSDDVTVYDHSATQKDDSLDAYRETGSVVNVDGGHKYTTKVRAA